jgi:hypothetical protein
MHWIQGKKAFEPNQPIINVRSLPFTTMGTSTSRATI